MSVVRDAGTLNEELAEALLEIKQKSAIYKQRFGTWPPSLFDGHAPLPANELLAPCKVVRDRLDIIRQMPSGCLFAEVGTLYGDFAVRVLDILRPAELHIFDLSFDRVTPENRNRLNQAGIRWHKGYSWDKLGEFPDGYFNVVYVDADHSYESVMKDLQQALRVTQKDGWIICNDYTAWSQPQCVPYGVYAAVNTFSQKHKLPFEYLALQVNGYYDVALRVP